MGEILDLKTIHDYNKFLGLETLNPLVGFVDFSKENSWTYYLRTQQIRLSGRYTGVYRPRTGGWHQRQRRNTTSARLCPTVSSRPYPRNIISS